MNPNIRSACGLIVAMLFAVLDCARANELPVLDCVVEPYEVIEVSSAAEGVLERVYVERNDLVTRGQIIAELESDVEKASLAYAQLNASLSSEIKLRRASLEFDERNKQRVQELYTKNAIPLHHRDEATTDAAKSHWLLTKAEDDKRLAALEYARASAVLKRKTVRSPITGVVVSRHKSAGEYIEDQAIITVAQLHPLRVEVIAPVELFGSISNGMRAEITPELAAAGPLTATVMSVDRVIDGESGTFDVRLELPNPDYAIPSGLKCEIAFTDAPAADEAGLLQPTPAAPVPAETEAVPPRRPHAVDLREASAPVDETSVDTRLASAAADPAGLPVEPEPGMTVTEATPPPGAGPPPVAGRNDEVGVDTPIVIAAADPAGPAVESATGMTVKEVIPPSDTATPTVANAEPVPASPHPAPSTPAVSADEPAKATSVASSAAPASEDAGAGAGAACRIIGPFKTDTDAERLLATLDSQHLSATPVQRTEEVVHSYILASPRARDQAVKDAIAAQIDAHGVKDTALLHTGPLKDRYSFGVYTNKVVAGIKHRSLKKLGFEIDMLPRKREVSRWWLEVVANTDAGTTWPVASGDIAGKLVSAQCAPDSAHAGASAASIAVH